MSGEASSRCGWDVVHSSPALNPDAAPLVRVCNTEMRFYLPREPYAGLDDEAFLALCEAKLNAQKPGPHQ